MRCTSARAVVFVLAVLLSLPAAILAQGRGGRGGGGPQRTGTVAPLTFRYVGPVAAGRIASVAGVTGDPSIYYLGAASGGVWKSTDGGNTFVPIFDKEDVAAIGALAVAPSDPNTVWAGTGEAWAIRDIDVIGDGIYKSTDAGATWQHMGLDNTGRIGTILVNPTDANTVFACALGRTTGPQQERGVYKTTDGGQHWTRVLFVNEWTGCSGLALDPNDPNTMLAGTWQVLMHPWGEFSGMWAGYTGTPGSGVYISHDAGNTWTQVTNGMPKPPLGKIDVAIAPSDGKRMYALIQTADQGSLWRSDDGGATWSDVNWNRTLIGRAGYYIRVRVNPQDENDVLVTNSSFHRSRDGGKTFDVRTPGAGGFGGGGGGGGGCGDCHDIWIDAHDGSRYVLTDDAGANIITAEGSHRVTLPDGQMYHVATDNRVPYWVYTNRQDNGTMRGPSTVTDSLGNGEMPGVELAATVEAGRGGRGGTANATALGRGAGGRAGAAGGRAGAAGAPGAAGAAAAAGFAGGRGGRGNPDLVWQYALGGCESGFTIPDPHDPDIVWASCYGDEVTRYDARIGTARSVSPWIHTLDSPPNDTKYRCHWTPPMAVDPFDGSVYYGCQVIFHTTDNGQSWKVISPDLSTQNPAHIVSSGGIEGDNLGQFYGDVVFAIAPSPIVPKLLWAGTNDGKVWYTKDEEKWIDVTRNISGLPPDSVVTQITPSSFNPAVAYVAVDNHLNDDSKPYLYRTGDYGASWTKISGGLPSGNPLDYARSISDDPNKQGLLFAGTGHAFFYSTDEGRTWTQFRADLPPSPVTWITVQKREHDVVLSTYGRGIWILPDIALLEQTGETDPSPSATKLYAPNDGIRQARSGRAEFLFSLASDPGGPVEMEIDDADGVVNKVPLIAHAGWNTAVWDLHYAAPDVVALRTATPENPHIWDEPRFAGMKTRPVEHWGIEGAIRAQPIAAPGRYTVKLTADGQTLSAPFTVVKDPAISSSDADLAANTKMQVEVRNDLTATADMVNRLEYARRQIEDQETAKAADTALVASLKTMDGKLLAVEHQFLSESDMQSDDKYYPEAYRVYLNLIWFNGEIGSGAGDVAGGAEYRPTDASYQVLAQIEAAMNTGKAAFNNVINNDLAQFNQEMAGKIPTISDQVPAADAAGATGEIMRYYANNPSNN